MTQNHCDDCGSFAPKGRELCDDCRPSTGTGGLKAIDEALGLPPMPDDSGPTESNTANPGTTYSERLGPNTTDHNVEPDPESDGMTDVGFEGYRDDAMFWFFVGLALVGAGLLLLWVMLP